MKTRNSRVEAKAELRNRFAPVVASNPLPTFRNRVEADLDLLKEKLLANELARTTSLDANVRLRRAANEAVALVWLTPYPLLLLPTLFEEKARAARRAASRQALIRGKSSELVALAE